MLKFNTIVMLGSWMALSCKDPSTSASLLVPRDTTITPEKAVTLLQLDTASLDTFIKQNVTSDTLAVKITNFYNTRNFQYAWFNENGLTEQAQAFWSQHEKDESTASDSSTTSRWLHQKMEVLFNEDTSFVTVDSLPFVEMNLTLHFFNYVITAFDGTIAPEELQWHIPLRKLDEQDILDSFLLKPESRLRIFNTNYYRLQNKLQQFLEFQERGGWPRIVWNNQRLKKGSASKLITAVKKRLGLTSNWSALDTSEIYSDSFFLAITKLQQAYGLTANGIIDASLISRLNIPAEKRVQQLLVNLQRMKWMPELPETYLLANIPAFRLHVIKNSKETLQMKVVVGKAANKTVIFSDELEYVVFSPYWNIPRSIVRNEIVPAMNRNKNYLRRNNMEITGYSSGLPIVRQRPGPGNALGKVKFIFPNRYNIYFHDTPSKSLFERSRRAFSHGCIRLEKPFDLAAYLLKHQPEWTSKAIRKAMNSSREKWVTLSASIPVFIVYFTAWVDSDGLLHLRDDIYGHDERMAEHLFKQ